MRAFVEVDGADIVRRRVDGVNHDAAVLDVSTVHDRLFDSIRHRSFATVILVLFSSAAAMICVAGLVSVVAFIVRRRTREIGVCMALGAPRHRIFLLIVGGVVRAAGSGVGFGLVLGYWGTRTLRHLLYGMEPGDGLTLGIACAAMLALIVFACVCAAKGALQVSPIQALRLE
jgi:ABC-type lipoprotein release transport system permease subunit